MSVLIKWLIYPIAVLIRCNWHLVWTTTDWLKGDNSNFELDFATRIRSVNILVKNQLK